MRTRHLLTILLPIAFSVLLLLLLHFVQDYDQSTWSQLAIQGCSEKSFALPTSVLPPELTTLLGSDAMSRNEQLRNSLSVTFSELGAHAFPGVPINVNCEFAAYDPNMINIYVVASDQHNRFAWADGLVLTRSDAGRVLVLGPHFWDFFHEAWRPILIWPRETHSPEFASAAGEFYVPVYEIYLQWAVAHELGHMKLGHSSLRYWRDRARQQQQETAADVEAAKMLRTDYYQITPHLLGLAQETMKFQFENTYHRSWTKADGEPFVYSWFQPEKGFQISDWHVRIRDCDPTHPPFLLRSLSMLEAASAVAIEQRKAIESTEKQRAKDVLRQERSIESELALEQLSEDSSASEFRRSDRWAASVNQLARQLRAHVDVEEPLLGFCFGKDEAQRKSRSN